VIVLPSVNLGRVKEQKEEEGEEVVEMEKER